MLAEFDSSDDTRQLHELGYEPELRRELGGFSNFALSFSIICILAGGVTSFHLGLGATGGASIGLGWPLVSLFSLCVAMTMAQVASAFPTAGGLYHWASLLGGKGWGWATAWFNLVGLVTVISAVNVGAWTFIFDSFLGAITSNTTHWRRYDHNFTSHAKSSRNTAHYASHESERLLDLADIHHSHSRHDR